MRIAVPFEKESGNVFQHFGHTKRFKVYDSEDGKVVVSSVVNTNGSGHGALADILQKGGVDKLICGGIGAGAKRALAEAGIEVYGGVSGDADERVEAFLRGELQYDSHAECGRHGEHRNGHDCGEAHERCGEDCRQSLSDNFQSGTARIPLCPKW